MLNNKIKLFGLLAVVLALPLIILVARQQQETRTGAAAPDKLEAEGGVLSSTGVNKQTDSLASGGQFVAFDLGPSSYFVSESGNDSNNGSQTSPWKTLQKAVNSVPDNSTIYIRNGTYLGADITKSNLTITSYPGENPVITPVKPDGTLRTNVIAIKGLWQKATTHIPSHNITISNLTIEGCFKGGLCSEGVEQGRHGAGILTDKAYDVVIENNIIRNNKSYGVRLYQSTNINLENNDISLNELGVEVNRKGQGVIIEGNKLHNNDKLIYKTPKAVDPSDDAGAQGLSLFYADGSVIVRNNDFWENRALSEDFIEDGGAMDIFGGRGPYLIEGNRAWNQDTFIETGQHWNDDPGATDNVANITFRRNVGWNLRTGVIARAAKNSLFANNTFFGIGSYKFMNGQLANGQYGWAIHQQKSSRFGGYIDGIKVHNNITVTTGSAAIYSFLNIPSSANIDHNLIFNQTGGNIEDSGIKTITELRTKRGIEGSGIQADPLFNNITDNDFSLKSSSPAIDKGKLIPGTTDGFTGPSPDLGYKEAR